MILYFMVINNCAKYQKHSLIILKVLSAKHQATDRHGHTTFFRVSHITSPLHVVGNEEMNNAAQMGTLNKMREGLVNNSVSVLT